MVKPLTGGIPMQVVWHGCRLFIPTHGVQMLQNSIYKRSAFLTMHSRWNSIDIQPFVHYYFAMVWAS